MCEPSETRTGGCLCGAVRYTVAGPMEDVWLCHCSQCRRSHGHIAAYAAAPPAALTVVEDGALAWYRSSDQARRGFCRVCGSSLFWAPSHGRHVSIAAGTLDLPTGLTTVGQICVADASDYYAVDPAVPVPPSRVSTGP